MERVALPSEEEFEARLREVLALTKENTCSMLQDIKSGRGTEIESLNQALVVLAEEHGIAVPINQTLVALVRACHP
jgi:2-dehydropantoate 2-reductase